MDNMKIEHIDTLLSTVITLEINNYEESIKLFDWCVDNFGIDNIGFTKRWMHLANFNINHIFLKNEEDITLFKLTWGY